MRKIKFRYRKEGTLRKFIILLIMAVLTILIRYVFSIDVYRPNLVIPTIVYLSLIAPTGGVIWLSFTGGILIDIFSYTVIGSYTIPLILLSWLLCLIRDLIYRRVWYIYIIATAITTMIVSIIIYSITSYCFKTELLFTITTKDILFNMLIDSAAMILLLPLFRLFLKE